MITRSVVQAKKGKEHGLSLGFGGITERGLGIMKKS